MFVKFFPSSEFLYYDKNSRRALSTPNFRTLYDTYKSAVEKRLASAVEATEPTTVYEPIHYVLSSGGKRLRAVLTLLACEAVGGRASQAMNAAVAIELLHNFTLIHDDVMDHAERRRGRPTVHSMWDHNVAILAGDELLAQAYRSLLRTRSPRLYQILSVYTDALVRVCEGQGFDKEFECRNDVTIDEYLNMIARKTGRVLSASLEIGALIGGGRVQQVAAFRKFGEQIGQAFQIQDDLLDVIGDDEDFGKKIGGDIAEGKKTFLLLSALDRASRTERVILRSVTPNNPQTTGERIDLIRGIYRKTGALDAARTEIERHTLRAYGALTRLRDSRAKSMLLWLAQQLSERRS
jgi:geranylgeranyl diphosphate synthase type II